MGKVFESITESLSEFITSQPVFFVATAASAQSGHINLSPKGLDSLRLLNDRTVVYADLIGSGIETVAHLRENGRIVLMFCAFSGPPKIVRLHGRGEVVESGHANFESLQSVMPARPGLRCYIRVSCQRISDSCGYGVPLMKHVGNRDQLGKWSARKTPSEMREYLHRKNAASIDGLPGITVSDFEENS